MIPYTFNVHMSPITLQCVDDWGDTSYPLVYYWMLLFVAFLAPIMVLLVVNYKIIRVVNHSLHFLGSHSNDVKMTSSQERQVMSSQERQMRHRHQENKRISRILASLLIAFVMFVLPNKVYWLMKYHGLLRGLEDTEMNILINVLDVCYSVHVSINPVIYSIIDVRFRKHLKGMFCY